MAEDELTRKLELAADWIISRARFNRLSLWKNVLFHPTATFAEELKAPSLARGAMDIFISYFALAIILLTVYAVIVAVIFIFIFAVSGFQNPLTLLLLLGAEIAIVLVASVFLSLVSLLGWLFQSGVDFILARLFGGKGSFTPHAYLYALSMAAFIASYLPLFVLTFIPCLGMIVSTLGIALSIYHVYLRYKAVRMVHGLGQWPAIAVILIPSILIFVTVILAYILLIIFTFSLPAR